jgi:ribonuclease inhibitor
LKLVIDGRKIGNERAFHAALDEGLDFGPHYGWNLAALRDRLSTDVERPIHLIWEHASASCDYLGAAVFGEFCALLASVAEEDIEIDYPEKFEFTLR